MFVVSNRVISNYMGRGSYPRGCRSASWGIDRTPACRQAGFLPRVTLQDSQNPWAAEAAHGFIVFRHSYGNKFPTSSENNKPDDFSSGFVILAVRTGLEPATHGVTGRYSNQLNYRTNINRSAKVSVFFFIQNLN